MHRMIPMQAARRLQRASLSAAGEQSRFTGNPGS
jgi:hypothetical protein